VVQPLKDADLPSVIPKTKKFNIGPGGGGLRGVQQLYEFDIKVQAEADIRNVIIETTEDTLIEQASLDNFATRLIVDKRDNKPLNSVEVEVEAFFGQTVNLLLLARIERTLTQEIRDTTETRTGTLARVRQNWQWIFVSREGGKTQPGVPVNPRSPDFKWYYGDTLILVPKRVLNKRGQMYASTVNTLVAQKGMEYTPSKGKNKGVKTNRRWGFARRTTRKVKRLASYSGVTVWAGHTSKFALPGETYGRKTLGRPLTIFIAVRNRAKRTAGFGGYRNFD
jgi:hypothetical protein